MTRPRVTTETEAANLALARIGASPVASLADASKRARQAAAAFGPVRDALLRRAPWNFARVDAVLVEEPVTDPPGRFSRRFRLAERDLAVWEVHGLGADEWEVSSVETPQAIRYLLTDATAPVAVVTQRRDPAQWDALFTDVFCDMLAAELADAINGGGGDGLRERAERKLLPALRTDAREAARGARPRDTSWIAARRGWRG